MIEAPQVHQYNLALWHAFSRLSAGREREPLRTPDIVAYARDVGLCGADSTGEFIDLMQAMDAVYLKVVRGH